MGGSPIDEHIGNRIQLARAMAGVEREELASALEISLEEMLAYERGEARLGAAALFTIAAVLRKPIGFFYEGLG